MNAPVQLAEQIDVETLDAMRQSGADITLLDVREPWELEICAIDGSLAIPLGHLPDRLDLIPQGGVVVVLCHHGLRSLRAASFLNQQGFPAAVNLEGGIDAWADRIDRTMTRY